MAVDFECIKRVLQNKNVNEENIFEYIEELKQQLENEPDQTNIRSVKKRSLEEIANRKYEKIASDYFNNISLNKMKEMIEFERRTEPKYNLRKRIASLIEGARGSDFGGVNWFSSGKGFANVELARFFQKLESAGFNPVALLENVDPNFDKNVMLELTTGLKGVSNDPRAVQMGGIIKESLDRTRDALESQGIRIGYIENYTPRVHNIFKMKKEGMDSWVNFMKERSNIQDTTVLQNIYKDITQSEIGTSFGENVGQPIAGRRAKTRKIIFNDPSTEFEYAQRFGEGSVLQSAIKYVEDVNYRAGIAHVGGPNPYNNIKRLVAELYKDAYKNNDNPLMDQITKFFDPKTNEFKDTGAWGINIKSSIEKTLKLDYPEDVDNIVLRATSTLKTITNVSSLAGSTLKAMTSDFWTRAVNLSFQGENLWSALLKEMVATFKPIPDELKKELLVNLGIESTQLVHECMKYVDRGDTPLVNSSLKKLEQKMFKYNLMNYVTTKARNLQALHMSENWGRNILNVEYGELNSRAQTFLKSYGVSEADYLYLRQNAIRDIEYYFDSPWHDSVEGRVAKPENYGKGKQYPGTVVKYLDPEMIMEKNSDLYYKLVTMYNREADMAVLHPNIATERLRTFNSNVRRGTVLYGYLDLLSQFRTFSLTYMNDYMMPIIDLAFGPNKNYKLFADIIGSNLMVHYGYMVLNDTLHNRDLTDLTTLDGIGKLMYHSGLAGLFTDAGAKLLSKPPYNRWTQELVPPALTKVDEAFSMIRNGISGKFGKSFKNALHVVPGVATAYNMYGLSAVWDEMLVNPIYNFLSPDGLSKKQKKIIEE